MTEWHNQGPKILGHSSVELTARQYAHLVSDDLKAGLDAVDVGRILAEDVVEPEEDEGPETT